MPSRISVVREMDPMNDQYDVMLYYNPASPCVSISRRDELGVYLVHYVES